MSVVTHAKVKFVHDGYIDILSIEKILEFKLKTPVTKYNFDRKILYTAYWEDDKNPEGITLAVQIGGLACKLFFGDFCYILNLINF